MALDRRHPRVFISYAHDSEHHKESVLRLCHLLVGNGIDVRVDQWADIDRLDWDAWKTKQILESDFVLAIASPAYRRVGDGSAAAADHRGIQAESSLLRDLLTEDRPTWLRKILPVLLPGRSTDDIPRFLMPTNATWYQVTDFTRTGADDLLRALTRQPRFVPPPLGPFPHLPPQALPDLLASVHHEAPWRGGDEVQIAGDSYLIHDPVPAEERSPDHGAVRREAVAAGLPDRPGLVLLRQVQVLRATKSAQRLRTALEAEARLLADLEGIRGFPRLRRVDRTDTAITLVLDQASEQTWRDVYGPGGLPLDGTRAARLLRTVDSLCAALRVLHERGYAHRALTPDAVLVREGDDEMALRSLGLATFTPVTGEGPPEYRAPEQQTPLGGGMPPGLRTDIYRLAAMLYHTLTGRPPGPAGPPPPSLSVPDLSPEVDATLLRALDPSPGDRPNSMVAFAAGLRGGRR